MKYNWQQADWPIFKYELETIHETLILIAEKMGSVNGKISHLSETLKTELSLDLLIEEAIKTSAIEGENLNRPDVRSSIKNKLGLNQPHVKVYDKRAQGIAELMLDMRNTFKEPLTEDQLFEWHLMLLSSSFDPNLAIARWRSDPEPMQIVSGHLGKQRVHYEAPPAHRVPEEMQRFITWFNETAPGGAKVIKFAPVRSAIAHLYFESIHPFEDGNGRIGRAISEKALSQGCGYPVLLSLSTAIERNRIAYYDALKKASKTNEITAFIQYFVSTVLLAQTEAENQIDFILKKTKFFDVFSEKLNERQMKVIQKMLKKGVQGFEGGMSAKKYMAITNASKSTATRDLQDLLAIEAVVQIGSGRSVRYELKL